MNRTREGGGREGTQLANSTYSGPEGEVSRGLAGVCVLGGEKAGSAGQGCSRCRQGCKLVGPVSKALCQVTDGELCSVVLACRGSGGLPAQRFAFAERQPHWL